MTTTTVGGSAFQSPGYAAGLTDTLTGLVRFGIRDYDPETGRWTARDPIGLNRSDVNLYTYVRNMPNSAVDPTGLWTVDFNVGAHVWLPPTAGAVGINVGASYKNFRVTDAVSRPPSVED
jgi:RHS repeat-associated protein